MIPLIGYTNKLSARPGDVVEVKVSSSGDAPYHASLVRIISGDPNPDGPGVVLEPVATGFEGDYPSRRQSVALGSHMTAKLKAPLPANLRLSVTIWPTLPDKPSQGVVTLLDQNGAAVLGLQIGPAGAEVTAGGSVIATDNRPLLERRWYRLEVSLDPSAGKMVLTRKMLGEPVMGETPTKTEIALPSIRTDAVTGILVAAVDEHDPASHYNGKIEFPALYETGKGEPVAAWNFSRNMTSFTVPGEGPLATDGYLVQAPARAMTGSNWNASEMNWSRAPEQYGAIHFHDDDIADAGWETDFTITIPDDLKSGAYAVQIACGEHRDLMPLFICPPRGSQTADLCLVISTFTYVIYANQSRADFGEHWRKRAADWDAFPYNPYDHPDFGLSTYNEHTDGSGICHTTWHRPILNLRPGYHVFGNPESVSGLRHFPADTHLLAWLAAKDIPFDIVTDWELHQEGAELLSPYKAVMTGSHPEYHTTGSLDAFKGYRDGGGKLIYLGGNGFYWRVALHSELDGLIEIRRSEGGLRAWPAEVGEYYHAFDGDYGGTWRRNARPPQQLVGVGYTVQGDFEGTYYHRKPDSYAADTAWIFAGIEDEIIGDFGFCGGGAAGYELDRVDYRLGTPPNTRILATSENHPDNFVLPPEEWLTHVKTVTGEAPEKLIRADMIYVDHPGGGAVFSTGSITFCGSLPTNNFDNNISRLLENVVRKFTG